MSTSDDKWAQRQKERERAIGGGVPVPGTGVRHWNKRRSGANKSGSLNKLNQEWGATARKQEDDQRGINNRAREQAIADQIASFDMADEWLAIVDAANCWDDNNDIYAGLSWDDE